MKIFNLHIMTNKEYNKTINDYIDVGRVLSDDLNKKINRAVINSVLTDIKKLRENTWDKKLADNIYNQLNEYANESVERNSEAKSNPLQNMTASTLTSYYTGINTSKNWF